MQCLIPQVLVLHDSAAGLDRMPPALEASHPCLWLLRCQQHTLWDGEARLSHDAEQWLAWLSPEEQRRWAAKHQRHDRDLMLLGRAALRVLLARVLGLPPQRVPLLSGAHGKPHLPASAGCQLHFNLSHAGDLVLIGLNAKAPIGVDLEPIEPWQRMGAGRELLAVARQVLPPATANQLDQLPASRQAQRFLEQWCSLEARLKALGTGFVSLGTGSATPSLDGCDQLYRVLLPIGYVGYCCVLVSADMPRI